MDGSTARPTLTPVPAQWKFTRLASRFARYLISLLPARIRRISVRCANHCIVLRNPRLRLPNMNKCPGTCIEPEGPPPVVNGLQVPLNLPQTPTHSGPLSFDPDDQISRPRLLQVICDLKMYLMPPPRDPTIRIWPGTRGGPGTRPDLTPQKSPPNAPRLSRLLQRFRFRATEVPGQLVGQLCGNLRRRILARQSTRDGPGPWLALMQEPLEWLDCPRVAANRGPSNFRHAASPCIELWMTRFSPILLQPQPNPAQISALRSRLGLRIFVREFSSFPCASRIISQRESIEQPPSRFGRPSRDY
jgi:hypothetical protein